jgi:hypothetical protein
VALIIEPKNITKEEGRKHIDESMIKTIAKAYK